MTEVNGPAGPPSAAPPEGIEELTGEIERTRAELGETVGALVAKADVTARARQKAAEVAGHVSDKASQLKETASQVKGQATARMSSAGGAAPEPVRRATTQAAGRMQQRQVLLAVAVGGALLAGWLVVRARRR